MKKGPQKKMEPVPHFPEQVWERLPASQRGSAFERLQHDHGSNIIRWEHGCRDLLPGRSTILNEARASIYRHSKMCPLQLQTTNQLITFSLR